MAEYVSDGGTNLLHPRVAVSGNATPDDVHLWGVLSGKPTYAFFNGSQWVYEAILEEAATWHGTNYRREGAFTADSQGRPVAMIYNRSVGVDALQLITRTGADTWVPDTVTPSGGAYHVAPHHVSAAAFALYNDVPYVVFIDLSEHDVVSGRRGRLYLTHKTGGEWSDRVLLDETYLADNATEVTAHVAINANGLMAISYSYLETAAAYPLTEGNDGAEGETRLIIGDANTLSFGPWQKVPVPSGVTYNAYYDGQVVFDYNDPLRIHLIQRTNTHTTSGGDFYRDAFYATAQISAPLPQALNVAIEGAFIVGETLTGTYDFESRLGTPFERSAYRWLRADAEAGPFEPIAGATDIHYTLTMDDADKLIQFEVTPLDSVVHVGPVASDPDGPVSLHNLPPTLDLILDRTINEDAGRQTVTLRGISAGPANAGQTVTITAESSDVTIIPHPTANYADPNATGSLTFTPVADAFGLVTITVTVQDDGGTANGGVDTFQRQFTVTVNPVNDPPTLDVLHNLTINEDAGLQTVNLTGISPGPANESGQTLTITAESSDDTIIPHPTVNYTNPDTTGSLTFTPVPDAFGGPVTITVTVQDDGGTAHGGVDTFQRQFTVTVNPVNDPPTLDAIGNLVIVENDGLQTVNLTGISPGPDNESDQTVTITAASSDVTIIPHPTVNYTNPDETGSLTFTPVTDAFGGPVTITVTVQDDGGTANGGVDTFQRQFTVTVNPLPKADNVKVEGFLHIGQTLTGSYSYTGNEPNQSTYRWLGADAEGGPYVAIDGATGNSYVLPDEDGGRFIKFEVTPIDSHGTGAVKTSAAYGPVTGLTNWDSGIIWQKTPQSGRRLWFGLGFHIGSDGRPQVGGEYSNTAAQVLWSDTPLSGGWGEPSSARHSYSMTTDVRNGHMARMPNGNLIFVWDGRRDNGQSEERLGYAIYDAVTQQWGQASYASVDGPNLLVPRVAVSGNALGDVRLWGVLSGKPTYAFINGAQWVYETILDEETTWHGTNYQREGAFTADSQGRPVAMIYNRSAGIDALQLFTRTGVDTWVSDTVTPSGGAYHAVPHHVSAAAFALHNDVPFVVFIDLSEHDAVSGRRGRLYLTHKTGGVWSNRILLDESYLAANATEVTAHVAINANGLMAISYSYLEKAAVYPLGGDPSNPAVGETRLIIGDANALAFGSWRKVPVPTGATYNAYFDGQVVFDHADPLRIHLIQRTSTHTTSGGDFYRDAFYATTGLAEIEDD